MSLTSVYKLSVSAIHSHHTLPFIWRSLNSSLASGHVYTFLLTWNVLTRWNGNPHSKSCHLLCAVKTVHWSGWMLFPLGCQHGASPLRLSVWHRGAVWQHRSGSTFGSTLVQVMACCLTAPSHYQNQCWLTIKCVLLYSPESSIYKKCL